MTIEREVLLEVVRKINFDDSDRQILLVRSETDGIPEEFMNILEGYYPDKQFLIIEQSRLDLLGDVPEEVMNEHGWIRKESLKNVASMIMTLKSKKWRDAQRFFDGLGL